MQYLLKSLVMMRQIVSAEDSARGNQLGYFDERHFEYDRFGNVIAERRGSAHKLLTTYEYDCRIG